MDEARSDEQQGNPGDGEHRRKRGPVAVTVQYVAIDGPEGDVGVPSQDSNLRLGRFASAQRIRACGLRFLSREPRDH
jgi:hypothetical protein